jgi:hypothetical protein
VEALNSTYGLASSEKERCSTKPKEMNLGETVLFNSNHTHPLGTGWGAPEEWGTWTVGKTATLNLPINLSGKQSVKMYLTANSFLGANHQTQSVDVLFNKNWIGKIQFTSTSNAKTRIFEIPIKLLKKSGETINLEFIVENPVSPSSLGISDDPRELGMGLISIKLE